MIHQPPARRQFVCGGVSCVNCRDIYFAFIRSVSSVQAGCLSLHSLLIALGRLSFVGEDVFWRESQGVYTPQWPKIVLTTQRLLEDSSYWSKTTAQTLGVNKCRTSSLFFSICFFSIWNSCWTSWTWVAGMSRPTRQRYTKFARCTGLLNENFFVKVF